MAGAEGQIRTRLLQSAEAEAAFSLPPTHRPCKAVKNSWKALGGGEGKQDPHVAPGETEGLGGCGGGSGQ